MSDTVSTKATLLAGTIVWGVILLVVAGITYAATVVDLRELSPTLVAWGVVGIGGLLVVAAIVGVIARAAAPRVQPSTAATDEDQPIG